MKFYMIAFLSAAIVASNFVAKAQEETVEVVTTKDVVKKSLSQDEVFDLLNNAASQVQVGGIYYTTEDQYAVLCVALDQNTLEQVVVYESLSGVNGIWVATLSDFVDLVSATTEEVVVLEDEYAAEEAVLFTQEVAVEAEDALVEEEVAAEVEVALEAVETEAELVEAEVLAVAEVVEEVAVVSEEVATVEVEVSNELAVVAETTNL